MTSDHHRSKHVYGPVDQETRAIIVRKMAARLTECGSYADERDAMRSLVGHFATADIMVLIDDARQVATQEAVAREMGA